MVTSPLAITPLPLSPLVTNLLTPLPPPPGDVIFERPLFVLIFARRNFRADLFSGTFHKTSEFCTSFRASSRKWLAKRTFLYSFFHTPALTLFSDFHNAWPLT